jgi:hypothetical protein
MGMSWEAVFGGARDYHDGQRVVSRPPASRLRVRHRMFRKRGRIAAPGGSFFGSHHPLAMVCSIYMRTVEDLIKQLSKLDPSLPVLRVDNAAGLVEIDCVEIAAFIEGDYEKKSEDDFVPEGTFAIIQ